MTNPGEFQQAVEQAKVSANSQIMTERDKAESLLASATDLLNSWARETGVMQADSPSEIKAVIDRLWVNGADKAVTGAYAAAAKALPAPANTIFNRQYWQAVEDCKEAILALTPADARQASQPEDEFVPETRHQQRVTIPANQSAAIASAAAQARLEEANDWLMSEGLENRMEWKAKRITELKEAYDKTSVRG